jgi:hypothetical protein
VNVKGEMYLIHYMWFFLKKEILRVRFQLGETQNNNCSEIRFKLINYVVVGLFGAIMPGRERLLIFLSFVLSFARIQFRSVHGV